MDYSLDIDCGAQSGYVFNVKMVQVVAKASIKYTLYSDDNGLREQKPNDWFDTIKSSLSKPLSISDINSKHIKSVGTLGQQFEKLKFKP